MSARSSRLFSGRRSVKSSPPVRSRKSSRRGAWGSSTSPSTSRPKPRRGGSSGSRSRGLAVPLPTKIEFSRRGLDDGVAFGSVDASVARAYQLPPLMVSHYDGATALRQKVGALAGRREVPGARRVRRAPPAAPPSGLRVPRRDSTRGLRSGPSPTRSRSTSGCSRARCSPTCRPRTRRATIRVGGLGHHRAGGGRGAQAGAAMTLLEALSKIASMDAIVVSTSDVAARLQVPERPRQRHARAPGGVGPARSTPPRRLDASGPGRSARPAGVPDVAVSRPTSRSRARSTSTA